MKIIFIILLIISCLSCSDDGQGIIVNNFPVKGELNAHIHHIESPILLPRYMGIEDGYLFVYKEREEFLFTMFRLPKLEFVNNMGKRGQGPNEFNILDTRSFNTCNNGLFSVLEAGSNMLKSVRFDNGKLEVFESEKMFDMGINHNGLYSLNENKWLTMGALEEDNEYCLIDKHTKEAVKSECYPEWTKIQGKNAPPKFVTYLKSCVVHPEGNMFASFYGRFKRMRIYNEDMKLIHDVNIKTEPCKTSFDEPIEKQPVYYIGQPYATEKHIYALCANKNTGVDRCELHVFDWSGNPSACYSFDRNVSLIAISTEYGKIYALDKRLPDELYVYDLPLND